MLLLIFLFSIIFGHIICEDKPCGDWEPFKDEKCFKLIDETLRPYDDAEILCKNASASLAVIHTKEEQDFLSNLLFIKHKLIDNVWIGVKNNSKVFKWIDNTDLNYTNWAGGKPDSKVNYDCVQMMPESTPPGIWEVEPCAKKNIAVCQKIQVWSLARVQQIFQDFRKAQLDFVRKQEEFNNQTKANPVPLWFIYVQLPDQDEPRVIWPNVEWTDVTKSYAGLFFRAEGGDSEKFGVEQKDNSPRLTSVQSKHSTDSRYDQKFDLKPGETTSDIYSGSGGGTGSTWSLTFSMSSGEVRPRNKAVRIWKRTK